MGQPDRYQMAVDADMEVGMKMGAIKPAAQWLGPIQAETHPPQCLAGQQHAMV